MRRKEICNWGLRIGSVLLSTCMLAGAVPEVLYAKQQTVVSVAQSDIQQAVSETLKQMDETIDVLSGDTVERKLYEPFEGANYQLVYVVEEEGITITGYQGITEGDLTIPDEIDGVKVVELGPNAFNGSGFTGTLKLSKYLKKIGSGALGYCGFTGTLELPDGLVEIADYGFYSINCTGDLVIPDSVTSIGKQAFYDSDFDGELQLSANLETIGTLAFAYCEGFVGNLVIPDKVTSIGNQAFRECTGFNGQLTLSKSLVSIDAEAFKKCTGLTGELIIPEGVTSIGEDAFASCTGFDGKLVIPKSLAVIPGGCFWKCSGFTELTLQEGLTAIEKSAFYQCTGLTGELKLPESLTTLGGACFDSCSGFTGVVEIPDSVKEIGTIAFYGCSGLTGVIFPEEFSVVKGFGSCTGLKSITLPKKVQTIEGFGDCTGLEGELELPEGLITIGSVAFRNCAGLTGELKLPETVECIGSSAFQGCTGLDGELKLPEGIKSIEFSAFSGCSGFTGKLELPESLTSLGAYAFRNCTGFSGDLVIPENVTSIPVNTFAGCTGLSGDIYIHENVTTIGENAFLDIPSVAIHGVTGSYAETYAEEKGYEFIPWGSSQDLPDDFVQEAAVSEGQCWILIMDEAARPIEDAEVKVTLDGEPYPHTYTNGTIQMEACSEKVNIRVSKEGMITAIKRFVPESGDGGYIKLIYLRDAIIITQVRLEEQDIDLTKEEYAVYTSQASEAQKSTLKIETSREGADCYQLVQGDKVLAETTTNEISVKLEEILDAEGGNVTLLAKIGGRTLDWEDLHFKVLDERWSKEEQTDSLEIGSEMKIPVPESVPFFGGGELELDTSVELPVQLTVEGDEVKLYLGGAKELLEDEEEEGDKSLQEIWADLQDEFKKEKKAADLSNTLKGGNVAGFDVSLELSGYGEGTLDLMNNKAAVEVGICLKMTASNGVTWYTFIGPVPVYVNVEGELEAEGNAKVNLTVKDGKLQNASVDLGHNIALTLGVGAGVGLNDVACIELNGSGTLGWEHQAATIGYRENVFANGPSDKVTLQAALEARAVLLFLSYSKSWPSDIWQLYPNPSNPQTLDIQGDVLYTASAYEVMERNYILEDSASESLEVLQAGADTVQTDDTQIIINGLYPDAKPQAVTYDGVDYLFYLDDCAERENEDKTALMYRRKMDGEWSEAKLVLDDATADFDFEACVGEDGIYIVWQNAIETMVGISTLEEAAKHLELKAVKVTGEEVVILSTPTVTTELAPICPSVTVCDGAVWACWFENSENNLLENYHGSNRFYVQALQEAAKETSEERQMLAETDYGVTTVDFGVMQNSLWGAFTADMDADMSTVQDREVYFMQNGTTYQVTDNETVDSNPQFGTLDGEQVIVYYADGNYAVKKDLQETASLIWEEQNRNSSDSFQFITSEKQAVIVWKNAYVLNEDVGQSLQMMVYENGIWGSAFEAAGKQDSVVAFTVLAGEENSILYTARGEYDNQEITRLLQEAAKGKGSAVITGLEYEETDYTPGTEFPMSIMLVNDSEYAVEKLELKIVKEDGTVVFAQECEEGIGAGAEQKVNLTGYAPEDTGDLQKVTLFVYAENRLCDSHSFTLGSADYLVTEETFYDEGDEILHLKVTNQTQLPGSMKLTITPENEENAIWEKEYAEVPAGSSVNVLCKLEELWALTTADTLVIQATSTQRTEEVLIDNTAKLYNFSRQTEVVTVELEQDDILLQPGETMQLTTVAGAENVTLYYKSNQEECVAVDANGLVTAIGEGIATITVMTADGFTDNCVVRVEKKKEVVKPYPFTDVPANEGNWEYTSANYVFQKDLMVGMGETTFAPYMEMERSMFVQILYSMKQKPEVVYREVFQDAKQTDWYSNAVIWAYDNKVTAGMQEGVFGSLEKISREQLALMLYKFALQEGYDVSQRAELTTFTDCEKVSDWAKEAMQWAVSIGVISGKPWGEGMILDPAATATRVECAAMMRKFCMKYVE